MPNTAMNATLIHRPLTELLLQPWSTATTQTKNNTIAAVLRVFSNMIYSSSVPQIRQDEAQGNIAERLRWTQ
jgi:hypothetical protein